MPSIHFKNLAITLPCSDGESLWEVAWKAGRPLPSSCGGKASCGLCRVKIVDGEPFLSPFNSMEAKHLGNVYFITKLRLGCQVRVSGGDVTVEVPDARPVERKQNKR
ncbi:MAG: (2Fe-2S)-binding protein [Deltaproteobacteria bacterium]|nr:(2Fe-2S)-binding protein [Deltaproteobacteria bacterium]